jgi:hypothetical protein
MYGLADQLKVKLHICNRDLLNEHAANTGYSFDLKRVEKFNECDEVANLIAYW